jgi:hypothetical protein
VLSVKEGRMEDWWRDLDDAILGCVGADGPLAPAEIGRRVGISEAAAASLVTLLAREGRLRIALVESTGRAVGA